MQIIEQANGFSEAINRTADIIPSIPVLTAQIMSLLMLPAEEQVAENPDTKEIKKLQIDINMLARFGAEELMRRQLTKATPYTGEQILKLLHPKRSDDIEKYKFAFEAQMAT